MVSRTYGGTPVAKAHYISTGADGRFRESIIVGSLGIDLIYNIPLPVIRAAIMRARHATYESSCTFAGIGVRLGPLKGRRPAARRLEGSILVLYGHRIRRCGPMWAMLYPTE